MSELNINAQDIRSKLIDHKKKCIEREVTKKVAEDLWAEIEKLLGEVVERDYDLEKVEKLNVVVQHGNCVKRDNRDYYSEFAIHVYRAKGKNESVSPTNYEEKFKDFLGHDEEWVHRHNEEFIRHNEEKDEYLRSLELAASCGGKLLDVEGVSILCERLKKEGYKDVRQEMTAIAPTYFAIAMALQIDLDENA